MTRTLDVSRSNRLWERSLGLIPAGTQTLAKGPGQWTEGVAPKYLARGRGARVWDVDGNEYVDLTMGVGPLVLGYCHPAVDEAIRRQLAEGITFSLMHPLEVEVSERIRELVPGAENVRFSKTGCDVTSAAVRLARAFTGREKVLSCGYHGWHDWYVAVTDRARGVPAAARELSFTFRYNDLDSLDEALDESVACVILEPMVFEEPRPGFLEGVRELCDRRGALLVFDEMWTGFRFSLGGAQQLFGVRADLACFSKAVANGMPLSVLTGRADVMRLLEREVFFFTTFGGEALSLAAALATLRELERSQVPDHLARQGEELRQNFLSLCREAGLEGKARAVGHPSRTLVAFQDERTDPLVLKAFVQQEMLVRGVLWGGFHNLSLSHGDAELAQVLAAYGEVLPIVAEALERGEVASRLRGAPLEPVFRRTESFHVKPRPRGAPESAPAQNPSRVTP